MVIKKLSRKELYNLVWATSIKQITEDYLVSFQSFKKICRNNRIPLPPNGYWSKKKFGKASPPIPLPKYGTEKENIILYRREDEDKRDLGELSDCDKLKLEIENDPKVDLKVSKKLSKKFDPIVKATKFPETVNHPKKGGVWDYTKRYDYGGIGVSVSENLLPKTLRIIDTLVRALKARGHTFSFVYERSYVIINSIEISLSFRERHKRIIYTDDYGHKRSRLDPLGLLILITGEYSSKKEWNETNTISLEKKLSQIIAYLEITAEEELDWKIESAKREKERQEQEKIERQKAEIRNREVKKLKDLIALSRQWHETQKLRKFLSHLEENTDLNSISNIEIKELIKFGREKADWLDPTIAKKDEILEGVNPYDFL
ncbi:hypothetical protein LZ575_14495 [Antarcticibacterium sp. 1MA-6-2]|uniref:hypothetical protein n=1 Tax=Antarcticibacterium sp. 1MA-6-2 TaxID=2908210 RepID=UPI001F3A4B8B|nr:hypothetical protein [Antarcticibacterium sp. 1MA-6-2]UJH90115.1 hypothetical protein LZ575_14495 [Antarcticibacterium sp. 1MA-6-2]